VETFLLNVCGFNISNTPVIIKICSPNHIIVEWKKEYSISKNAIDRLEKVILEKIIELS